MAEPTRKLTAIKITRATTVAVPSGGGKDVKKGTVLGIPNGVTPEDASYLIALGKAEAHDPRAAKSEKDAEK